MYVKLHLVELFESDIYILVIYAFVCGYDGHHKDTFNHALLWLSLMHLLIK